MLPRAWVAAMGVVVMLGNAGLGLFHTGVERDWWEGPTTCSGGAARDLTSMSGSDLLDFSTGPQIVACDEAAWHFLGLSMASWNGLFCLIFAALWLWASVGAGASPRTPGIFGKQRRGG